MMRYNLRSEQWVPVSLDRVFTFFADPNNLPRISPPELDVRIEKLKIVPPDPAHPTSAAAGSDVVVSFRVPILGFRIKHVAHITGFEINRSFRDQHSRLPLIDWDHRHGFEEADHDGVSGTLVRDDLHYALGPSLLGAIPNALLVRRQLEKMFQFRRRALAELVEAHAL